MTSSAKFYAEPFRFKRCQPPQPVLKRSSKQQQGHQYDRWPCEHLQILENEGCDLHIGLRISLHSKGRRGAESSSPTPVLRRGPEAEVYPAIVRLNFRTCK